MISVHVDFADNSLIVVFLNCKDGVQRCVMGDDALHEFYSTKIADHLATPDTLGQFKAKIHETIYRLEAERVIFERADGDWDLWPRGVSC